MALLSITRTSNTRGNVSRWRISRSITLSPRSTGRIRLCPAVARGQTLPVIQQHGPGRGSMVDDTVSPKGIALGRRCAAGRAQGDEYKGCMSGSGVVGASCLASSMMTWRGAWGG